MLKTSLKYYFVLHSYWSFYNKKLSKSKTLKTSKTRQDMDLKRVKTFYIYDLDTFSCEETRRTMSWDDVQSYWLTWELPSTRNTTSSARTQSAAVASASSSCADPLLTSPIIARQHAIKMWRWTNGRAIAVWIYYACIVLATGDAS